MSYKKVWDLFLAPGIFLARYLFLVMTQIFVRFFREKFVLKSKKQPQIGIFSFFAKRAEHEWCDRELFMAGST